MYTMFCEAYARFWHKFCETLRMCVYIVHIYYDINFKLKIQNNVVTSSRSIDMKFNLETLELLSINQEILLYR